MFNIWKAKVQLTLLQMVLFPPLQNMICALQKIFFFKKENICHSSEFTATFPSIFNVLNHIPFFLCPVWPSDLLCNLLSTSYFSTSACTSPCEIRYGGKFNNLFQWFVFVRNLALPLQLFCFCCLFVFVYFPFAPLPTPPHACVGMPFFKKK